MNLDAFRQVLQAKQIAYALAEADLRVIEIGGAATLLGDGGAGDSLPDLIPELVGSEALLRDLLRGKRPFLRLEQINRDAPLPGADAGGRRYLTLTVRRIENGHGGQRLLAVLADTTPQGRYMQLLTQQRNDLTLLQQELAQANALLDHLLRHYVPTEVANALLSGRVLPHTGGELRTVSVLFADLSGYSRIAGQLPPTRTMEMVNHYLTIACDAIAQAGGTITQFMGDAVMALFNAPDEQPDHAWRAVQAGLTIQQRMADRRSRPEAGFPPMDFGVGVHSGPAVVGNTGAHWRYAYSAIGDTTNTAFRLCGLAQGGEVLIGFTTYRQVRDRVVATALAPVHLRGKSRPLPIFRVESNLSRTPAHHQGQECRESAVGQV